MPEFEIGEHVFVACNFRGTNNQDHLFFRIEVSDGSFDGGASWAYCFDEKKKKRLRLKKDEWQKGHIVAILLKQNGEALVNLPDGENCLLPLSLLAPVPPMLKVEDVPVES